MLKMFKVTKETYKFLYDNTLDRYVFKNDRDIVIGISEINNKLEKNKIRIEVSDIYRGNGYGNEIFKLTLDEYKKLYNSKDLIFEINNDNLFNNILYKFGAIHIANYKNKAVYVLPLNKDREE